MAAVNLFDGTKVAQRRWTSATKEDIIAYAKRNADEFHLACSAVDAAFPVLAKFKEGMVCEPGDVPFFLHILMHDLCARASLIIAGALEDTEVTERLVCEDASARDLIAAYLLTFQDAAFTMPNGFPLVLMNKEKPAERRFFTLNNLRGLYGDGARQFMVGCVGDKDDLKKAAEAKANKKS